MSSDKCSKCSTNFIYDSQVYFATSDTNKYHICWDCYREWTDNGYSRIWYTFYCSDNFDLADKFMLDYLGKLGE